MKEKALEVLRILNENDYDAFIVGGYVRAMLLDRKTSDIDIATSATPKEVLEIFDNVSIDNEKYGSVIVTYKGIKFDVTTFRKEIKYEDNRKPIKIKYIKDIKKDLLRRDFTINTLCMNKDGKVLDILNVKDDLYDKVLRTVGNPRYRFKEDALRILRCIRFATILDFSIDSKTSHYVTKYSYLLKKLSKIKKPIKDSLLDQSIISGIGNIYDDEILFRSNISPFRKANEVTLDECDKIIKNTRITLDKAIELGGTTIKSFTSSEGVHGKFQNELLVHGKKKDLCPVCKSPIINTKINGRGTYYCKNCQK